MDKELRILILEDNPADAELEEHELRKTGLVFTLKVVDTKEALLKSLDEFSPDIILSDYDLPTFDGLAALKIAKEKCPDVPFILVTGKLGEEFAIEKLKEGATDYVLKGNLKRLAPSVNRALEEAKKIREHKQAEKSLRESEERYRTIMEQAADAVIIHDETGRILDVNRKACQSLGYSREELLPKSIRDIDPDAIQTEKHKLWGKVLAGEQVTFESRNMRKDGSAFPVEVTLGLVRLPSGLVVLGIIRDITERKRAEKETRWKTALLEAQMNATVDGILIVDEKGNKVIQNQRCIDLWKIPHHIVDNRDDKQQVEFVMNRAKDPQKFVEKVIYLYSHPNETSHEELEFKDGTILDRYSAPVIGKDGTYFGRIWIFRDVTERVRAAEALRASEERYREAQAIGHVGNWEYNIQTNHFWGSDEAKRIYGFDPEQADFSTGEVENCIPERERVHQALVDLIEANKPYNLEFEIHPKNSLKPRIISSVAELKRDEHGNPLLVTGVIQDITERKRVEEDLKESEELFHLLSEATFEAIAIHKEGVLLNANDQYFKMFGYEPGESLGKEMLSATIVPESLEFVKKQIATDSLELYESIGLRKDGTRFPIEVRTQKMKYKGRIVRFGAIRDITERKKAEDALRTSEAELHDNYFTQTAINMILSESLEDIPLELMLQKALNMILAIPWLSFESIGSIHIIEGEPGILSLKAHYNLPKQLRKSCANVPLGKCLCGKAAQTRKTQFADHIDERHDICYEGMQPHGHYVVPVLFGGRTLGVIDIYLKEGHIRNRKEEDFLLTVADTLAGIIVRKQTEEEKEKLHAQLLQAQKMEVVGQLAGGIAHDFNNILAAMIGYGHILKMKLKEEDPLRSYADHILSLSDRAANLTQSLLAFSRKQINNPRTVDINEIIKRIDYLLSRIIGEDIKLQTLLSEKDLIVMADPVQIEQVLMNLASNARDAMPKGGVLTIGTEAVDIDHEFIREHGFGNEGRYALITLTDTGAGMDRETREKIFEPFFTTKEVGKGTGLGLSMVYGVIEQHDGHIDVYSEPGSGTTFRIYLPLIEANVEEIQLEVIQPVETGTETVLLAEDETEVREFTKKLLEEYGYKVITAGSGQEAINKFKAHKDKIQLLLLDVIMPNRNGREAYEEIKKIRPDIKVLFMSGYPADIIHKHDIIEKGFAYIEKPASPTELLRKIRDALGK